MLKGENSILLMSANPEPECVDMQNLTEPSMISTGYAGKSNLKITHTN